MAQDEFQKYLEEVGEYGVVTEVRHTSAVINGLPKAKISEIVIFESGERGEVFAVNRDEVEVLVFSPKPVKSGTRLVRTGKFMSVPVGRELLGTLINPLGEPFSYSKAFRKPKEEWEVHREVDGIYKRARIDKPFTTGVSVVDLLIPLGRGQKELVIGDRKTGKTSFILSAIKNQVENSDTVIVYAAIARKTADIKKLQEFFEDEKLSSRIVTVASSSQDPPSLIYLTPYSAMTIAEYFRDAGKEVLVILDDLSTHAKFYREIALVGKHFPGRDSYPGDIFYTHAKLLERTGNFKHKEKGEVAITCFPIVETVEGDLTGFIATNIMGMTDGHIYFDSGVYRKGRRPAINTPLSVTRVGKQTQSSLKREINNELTAFLATYERMQNYSHFGSELSPKIKSTLKLGEDINALFNQSYTVIIPEAVQVLGFALVWLQFFQEAGLSIEDMQKALLTAYRLPEGKKLIDTTVNVQTFTALQQAVTKNKPALLQLCKTSSN